MDSWIKIFGAREHNLKGVDVAIPKNKFVVITGPSGSGKSSIAMDTLYQEGRRRYVQSLSTYARQFLGVGNKPKIDKIDGICPAIAIDQKSVGFNPRSTVGTITEIYDYVRLLFARAGTAFCSKCNVEISHGNPDSIVQNILSKFENRSVYIAAPLALEKKGEFSAVISAFFLRGHQRFFIDGRAVTFESQAQISTLGLGKKSSHSIFVLLDEFKISEPEAYRVRENIVRALDLARNRCAIIDRETLKFTEYSTLRVCGQCGGPFPELEPRLFSFNSPVGACQGCEGLGLVYGGFLSLTALEEAMDSKQSFYQVCKECSGSRLNSNARSVRVSGKNIHEVCSMPIEEALIFIKNLELPPTKAKIVQKVQEEVSARLGFLCNVGLAYLTLGRSAPTLSGGESQRIRLATQIGSALAGVLYVLDEPSIGLHQRDNQKLIETLFNLRDVGNTVVVVEHDMEMIERCDYVIDVGPGAGSGGGNIVAVGTPKEVANNPESLTGRYMRGVDSIELPPERREPVGFLKFEGVKKNNIKNIDITIPLGVMTVFTGVSGSGKSSFVSQTMAPFLTTFFSTKLTTSSNFKSVDGLVNLNSVVSIDQAPIGRTPRSNPATYVGLFGAIRTLFAELPESKAKGYDPGYFSFNVKAGRCGECDGEGSIKISMLFMEDEVVVCDRCHGRRYSPAVLDVRYNDKNINDVLEMTCADAAKFFKDFSAISRRLELLCEVGLDYMVLGQSSTTLSGGEAQRIKLVCELAKRGTNTLYILDEPTVGLHNADVKKLLFVLNRLIARGNSIVVIEHNLDFIKCADYIIDMGPEGGSGGGNVVAQGTPEQICESDLGYTAKYLKQYLKLS